MTLYIGFGPAGSLGGEMYLHLFIMLAFIGIFAAIALWSRSLIIYLVTILACTLMAPEIYDNSGWYITAPVIVLALGITAKLVANVYYKSVKL